MVNDALDHQDKVLWTKHPNRQRERRRREMVNDALDQASKQAEREKEMVNDALDSSIQTGREREGAHDQDGGAGEMLVAAEL